MDEIQIGGITFQRWTVAEILEFDFEPEFPELWKARDMEAPYVYFILAHEPDCLSLGLHNARFVKIGVAADPLRREKAISTDCPLEINLKICTRGGYPLEKRIHEFLKDYRINGEWFKIADLVTRVIQDAPDDMPEITW